MTDEDPEVAADIALRARSERERPKRDGVTWQPPRIVDRWPCRACKVPCDVSSEAMDGYEAFNRMLVARNEPKLDFTSIMFCDSCRVVYTQTAADRRRGQVERMRPAIEKLRASRNPEQEYTAIEQLKSWGHPDVAGLLASIRARIDGKGKRNTPEGL